MKYSNGQTLRGVNELEFVDGQIWGNVYGWDGMVRIDPDSGYVTDSIDFAPLRGAEMALV